MTFRLYRGGVTTTRATAGERTRRSPSLGAAARLTAAHGVPAESCCLPALTRFTGLPLRRTRPPHGTTGCDDRIPSSWHLFGGVRERPNRHDWKSCVAQVTVGSNP